MAFHRRRHHDRCLVPAVSTTSAFSAASLVLLLLLFLACLSFLGPPFLDHSSLPDQPYLPHHRSSSDPPIENFSDLQKDASGVKAFRVPIGGGSLKHDLWGSKLAKYYFGCSNASNKFAAAEFNTQPNRYLMIATSGGLNQQRTGITDAVVAARILNATLVVPKLDPKSFWKDASNFAEIFDVDWFISSLSKDIKIIKELPKTGGKVIRTPYNMRVPRKCDPRCYQNRVLPVLLKNQLSSHNVANILAKDG